MNREFILPKSLVIFGICVPLALFLGYLLATPDSLISVGFVTMVVGLITFPLLMRWHHPLLILSWNASLIVYFMPGQPSAGMIMAVVSLFFALLNRSLRKEDQFIHVPSVAWPLVIVAVVVLITAEMTGGIGGKAFGSESWGGKRYFTVIGSILGYFALVSRRIKPEHAKLLVGAFFLMGITSVVSNIAYALGPSFYFLYAFFPTDAAFMQATTQEDLSRLPGVTWACLSAYYYLLTRYNIRGIFVLHKPWRLLALLLLAGLSLLGGFRTAIAVIALTFSIQFYLEGLHRSRLLPILLCVGVLGGVFLVGFADRLPLSVQRSISFLPIDNIDPLAKSDAASTLDWRFEMWKTLVPEIPNYLILGKGFAFSGTDYLLTQEAMRRGMFTSYEDTLINGNYHNGILTVLIPFGIFGTVPFFFFCAAGWRVLYRNFKYGSPDYRKINSFMLSYYVAHLIFYVVFYGQFDLDLQLFTGAIGLSIALNNGVARPATVPEKIHEQIEQPAAEPALQT